MYLVNTISKPQIYTEKITIIDRRMQKTNISEICVFAINSIKQLIVIYRCTSTDILSVNITLLPQLEVINTH